MSYSINSKIPAAISENEIDLLTRGFTYPEVAGIVNRPPKSISERNRLVYKIDIWEAFRARLERDGVPNRLDVSDSFGSWFSGFFDGEGTIVIFTRPCTSNDRYSEYRLSVRIQIRDDDAGIITRIKDNLKIGTVHRFGQRGHTKPTIGWTCERVEDLVEVIIPLFDKYPLYSKKAQEFAIWRPIVIDRYVSTLGGYSNRSGIPDEERAAFNAALDRVKKIRTYS